MAIVPVTIYGDKVLKENTKIIEEIDDNLISDIKDMFDTMRNANGVGLAGNQIGLDKSVFVIDLTPVEGYEKFKPMVFINPEILEESYDKVIIEEGCLSLPYLRADVERAESIRVKYLDTDENEQILEADDYLARVILHEYDHLVGKMIPDRINTQQKKRLKKDILKIMRREIDVDYLITDKKG